MARKLSLKNSPEDGFRMLEDGSYVPATAEELAMDIDAVPDALLEIMESNTFFEKLGIESIAATASETRVAKGSEGLPELEHARGAGLR